MMLLDPDERALVKATVVNKFRGDVTILEPGLDILREKTGVPVAGVVPYAQVDIDDEDSMSSRFTQRDAAPVIDIAVVRLPKISNFTDFISLEAIDGVGVRYVARASELGVPDLIVIPGTKSTMADLRWLRASGLEAAVLKLASRGTAVFGICGGYQMLGQHVSDPHGSEGGGEICGMGLLPSRTVFSEGKHTTRSTGTIGQLDGVFAPLSGIEVEGYEIHMGASEVVGGNAFCTLAGSATTDGCQVGNVCGTYLHGIFDRQECAQALVGALCRAKGIDAASLAAVDMRAYKEEQYDKLADAVRGGLDMELVYRILEEGI